MLFDTVRPKAFEGKRLGVPVIIYGNQWCAKTQMVRRYLDRMSIPYTYIDLDSSPQAEAQLRWRTEGPVAHPTVYIGGQMLTEPTIQNVQRALAYAVASE